MLLYLTLAYSTVSFYWLSYVCIYLLSGLGWKTEIEAESLRRANLLHWSGKGKQTHNMQSIQFHVITCVFYIYDFACCMCIQESLGYQMVFTVISGCLMFLVCAVGEGGVSLMGGAGTAVSVVEVTMATSAIEVAMSYCKFIFTQEQHDHLQLNSSSHK